MKLNFRNFPYGSLPYDNIRPCKQMILRLYERIPYLPFLPFIDKNDNIRFRTFENIPCVTLKDGKFLLPESTNEKFVSVLGKMERDYNSDNPEDYSQYGSSDSPFSEIYYEMIRRFKPEYTIINLLGPFSFANMVFNKNATVLLTDRAYRKFIIQAVAVKAMWFVSKIKEASPNTKPIIMFEEDLLYKFGTIKRTSDVINQETVTTLFNKVFSKVQKTGGLVAVQSLEKCNWQLVFDSGNVDIISFDAYNNPNNLHIISSNVNKFLANGGYINWAIIPSNSENAIRGLNAEMAYDRLIKTFESLIAAGVSADLVYKQATISVLGNMEQLPILFAEKALMILDQISKKVPYTSASK